MVVHLSSKALGRHAYLLGASGVGKSKAIEGWVIQLIRANQGVALIAPDGDLYHSLVARIAQHGKRLWSKVILFDPMDETHAIGLNPLELKTGEIPERKALFLATAISKIHHADPLVTSRMQRIMFHTFWLLILSHLTLEEFARVLTNQEFRTLLLKQLPAAYKLKEYWREEFPKDARLITEWTQSSLNKVDEMVVDPALRAIFGQYKSTIDFRKVLDEGKILLVNLSKGQLISKNSYLMGAFIVALLQLAAYSRAENAYVPRNPYTLLMDEFQNFATDEIHELLSEVRKYKLSLVLSHQFFEQLRDYPKLQAAVLGTVGNFMFFRQDAHDAEFFAKKIFSPDLKQVKYSEVMPVNWGGVVMPRENYTWYSLSEIWELEGRKLSDLKDREFWYKRRGEQGVVKVKTLDLPDVKMSAKLAQAIAELTAYSNATNAKPITEVEKEIEERTIALNRNLPNSSLDESESDDDIPPNEPIE